MADLYTTTTLECSKLITEYYSTSFTLGIKTLDKKLHTPIYAIYAFVRYADEIVDTFHDYDKEKLLRKFSDDTYDAIDQGISLNPVLHSFQLVVNQYGIDRELIDAFLKSMEMDLIHETYSTEKYQEYIYGSAEVVGLMCLHVFCSENKDQYNQLKDSARSLGSAFQKVNFLRDIQSDYKSRGRIYFPEVDFKSFSDSDKEQIELDIEKDFSAALDGIKALPKGARAGVYLAYIYYYQLFKKIKRTSPKTILNARVRIPDGIKFILLTKTLILNKLNVIG